MFLAAQNLVFVHIPKTGGNSLQKHFVANWGASAVLFEKDPHTFELRDSRTTRKHQPLMEYQKLLGSDFSAMTIAWVWRDPAERLASWYFSRHRKPQGHLRGLFHEKSLNFPDFTRFIETLRSTTEMLRLEHPPFPRELIQLDFMSLASDLRDMEAHFGIEPSAHDLPQLNSSLTRRKKIDYSRQLSREGWLSKSSHVQDYKLRFKSEAQLRALLFEAE